MGERGVSIVELLIAALVGVVVLLGAGSLYVATVRFSAESNSQTFLQRQAALIIEEMARQIRPATALTRGVCNADPNSLGTTIVREKPPGPAELESFCFYAEGGRLFEEQTQPAGKKFKLNLFSASPVPLTVTVFDTCGSPPPCRTTPTRAYVEFQLLDGVQNSMRFRTTINLRN